MLGSYDGLLSPCQKWLGSRPAHPQVVSKPDSLLRIWREEVLLSDDNWHWFRLIRGSVPDFDQFVWERPALTSTPQSPIVQPVIDKQRKIYKLESLPKLICWENAISPNFMVWVVFPMRVIITIIICLLPHSITLPILNYQEKKM